MKITKKITKTEAIVATQDMHSKAAQKVLHDNHAIQVKAAVLQSLDDCKNKQLEFIEENW